MWKFKDVNPKQSFPELEEQIQKFWEENNIFKKSIENRQNAEEFNFYDGPPFATWLPHYGHLLAWTIKDVIPRFQTMKGKKVERIFWWDCHWLPIENLVEKKLGISWRDDIEKKVWIDKFNETCRENVLLYTQEWKKIVKRIWRWVDVDNPYIAMDKDFMEVVWWVFKKLYNKWLVYQWNKVVSYCPRCATSLSNFEVAQWYKDKSDKTITVKFKIWENRYILAWTTTPWTIIANVGLALWKDILYVEVKDKKTDENYILAKDRLKYYYKNEEDYDILKEYKWEDLVWIKYEPLISELLDENSEWVKLWKNAYTIVIWHHVTTESGTGIVHIAPSYWEDDFIIWKENDLWYIFFVDDNWKTSWLKNLWTGKWVFDFNQEIIDYLKNKNLLVKIESITHSYPHCWRCDTPLLYRAIPAWYVKATNLKDDMIHANKKVYWVPEHVWTWRFWKWLENLKDWNISRNRYWATPIPVWQDEEKTENLVVWTIKELYEYNKDFWQIEHKNWRYYYTENWQEIDLHKHFVDKIKLKSPKTWKTLKRIPELLDVWFDSGSMPYALARIIAKRNYNMSSEDFFDNMDKIFSFAENNKLKYDYRLADIEHNLKEIFKFPANFIAEWQDQTRWWFYTLLVLGVALFKNTPYYNVIVNWIVLAEDWKKMSKSLKNYPDPMDVVNKYWADSVRFYIMNSQAVQTQELRFSERWVEEVTRKVMLPLWNTYYFFTTYANIDLFDPEKDFKTKRENKLDIWIISEINKLIKDVEYALSNYTINDATKYIVGFIDRLTNWYIRRSRRRFWKSENDIDKYQAYSTLYEVLIKITQVLSPISPFMTDYIYKDLTQKESIHLSDWQKYEENLIDEKLNYEMMIVQNIVSLWLSWRSRNKIRTRQPLNFVKITEDLEDYYKDIIKEELNVKDVIITKELAKKIAKPDWRKIWSKYWKSVQDIIKNAKLWNFKKIQDDKIKVFWSEWEFILEKDEYTIEFIPLNENVDLEAWFGIVVALDKNISDELLKEWFARDIIRYIQELRKKANYNVADRIYLEIIWNDFIKEVVEEFKNYIETETLSKITKLLNYDIKENFDIEDQKITISLKK